MKVSNKSMVLTAALTGLLGGTMNRVNAAVADHDGSGLRMSSYANAFAGQASGKTKKASKEKHGCAEKNSCKGKGGCATDGSKENKAAGAGVSEKHGCAGKNSCKGNGGCATDGKKK